MQTCIMGYFPDFLHLIQLPVPPTDSGTTITYINVLVTLLFPLEIIPNMVLVSEILLEMFFKKVN